MPSTSSKPAVCGKKQNSGGAGITTNEYDFSPWSGVLSITYNMYSQPDKMTIYLDNVVVATTSKKVAGKGTFKVNYPGKGKLKIVMEGDTGTVWDYQIDC